MRKFLLALALLLGVLFIITRFAEVNSILMTFEQGEPVFILLALLVEVTWILNFGTSYYAIYQIIGMEESRFYLMRLAIAANFINVITPAGGMGGLALFVANARQRGYSAAKATVAGALSVLFDYAAFICVLTIGLLVLFRRNNLNWPEILASLILLTGALVLGFLLYLATRSAERLGAALAWLARLVNRLLHPIIRRDYLSIERAHTFAQDAADGVSAFRDRPLRLLLPFSLALSKQALLLTVFFLTFLAFRVPLTIGTLVAGFSMGYLFLIVSPTPSGIGVVEGVLTLTLSTLRIPLDAATVVALAYRGVTFWFPLLIGMITFRSLEGKRGENERKVEIN